MTSAQDPEVWLRGPLAGYPPLFMPVAHALLQVREDVARLATTVPESHVWQRPGGAASIGFHVRHIGGALDRLLTYARGQALTATQLTFLRAEGVAGEPAATIANLLAELNQTIDAALLQLRSTDPAVAAEVRHVGRAQLPSTVIGLLFHAAEHSSRHAGQAITTARVLQSQTPP
jgi:hypothetical protein